MGTGPWGAFRTSRSSQFLDGRKPTTGHFHNLSRQRNIKGNFITFPGILQRVQQHCRSKRPGFSGDRSPQGGAAAGLVPSNFKHVNLPLIRFKVFPINSELSLQRILAIPIGAALPKLFYASPPRRNPRGGALTISIHTLHI